MRELFGLEKKNIVGKHIFECKSFIEAKAYIHTHYNIDFKIEKKYSLFDENIDEVIWYDANKVRIACYKCDRKMLIIY